MMDRIISWMVAVGVVLCIGLVLFLGVYTAASLYRDWNKLENTIETRCVCK